MSKSPPNIEMVIARFQESLEWLRDPPFCEYSYRVYNKGSNSDFYCDNGRFLGEVKLPNVGREAHSYLYHIVTNWNDHDHDHDQDMITVFLPGSVDSPHKYARAQHLLHRVATTHQTTFSGWFEPVPSREYFRDFQLDTYQHTHIANQQDAMTTTTNTAIIQPAEIRPYGKWFDAMFADKTETSLWRFLTYHAMFAVRAQDIYGAAGKGKSKSKAYYEKFLNQLSGHPNPEVGHFMERSYPVLFSPDEYALV
jgi:hypothetical protein